MMEEGNGLNYIRARYYAPELGRFISKDRKKGDAKNGQSLNGYLYGLNNPILLVDISGYSALESIFTEKCNGTSDLQHTLLIDVGNFNTAGSTPPVMWGSMPTKLKEEYSWWYRYTNWVDKIPLKLTMGAGASWNLVIMGEGASLDLYADKSSKGVEGGRFIEYGTPQISIGAYVGTELSNYETVGTLNIPLFSFPIAKTKIFGTEIPFPKGYQIGIGIGVPSISYDVPIEGSEWQLPQ